MAYMNQEKKAAIAAELKKVMPPDWKYSLRVQNHSTLVCCIKSAPIDLLAEMQERSEELASRRGEQAYPIKDCADVNPYHYLDQFSKSEAIISGIMSALNTGNHNNSDSMTDYFDVGFYAELEIGRWDKPFVVTKQKEEVAA